MSEPVIVVQTERQRRRVPRGEVLGGLILIILGAVLFLPQAMPELALEIGDYIVLIVGVALLVLFLITRSYGALIPGSIVTGVGAGIALQAQPGIEGGAAFLISLGAGFLLIWVLGVLFRVPENHWWPFIPGLILIAIGLLQIIGPQADELFDYGWPIALIALGAVVVLRAMLRRRET